MINEDKTRETASRKKMCHRGGGEASSGSSDRIERSVRVCTSVRIRVHRRYGKPNLVIIICCYTRKTMNYRANTLHLTL